MTPHQPGFSGGTLDRVDHLRENAEAIAQLQQHHLARLLRLDGYDPVLDGGGTLVWDSLHSVAPEDTHEAFILLGLRDEAPYFVALKHYLPDAIPVMRSPRTSEALAAMGSEDLAVFGAARSLIDWHARHRFCGKCGAPTLVARAGWGRRCQACDSVHFPRVDPVVIMLAEHDERVLVGRQAGFAPGRYSALAGFLEPGETIEEAVARELFEEAGVRATRVRYITSQPWPFPAQLMVACIAEVQSDVLHLAADEIEDAIWVTREEARWALAGDARASFSTPPAYAVAHSLLQHWVDLKPL